MLHQLIYLDNYSYNKKKPKDLFGIEPDKKEQNHVLTAMGFNIHQHRYAYFPVSFDINHWLENYEVKQDDDTLVVQFTGTEMPTVFSGRNNQ